jgi:hypothetical protein
VKPNLFSLAVPLSNVKSFIKSIVRHVFSYKESSEKRWGVWGSRRNHDAVMSAVDFYLGLARHDTVSISTLIKNIKLNELAWNTSIAEEPTDVGGHHDDSKRCLRGLKLSFHHYQNQFNQSTLFLLIHWLFLELVNPILRLSFYCTEGEGTAHFSNE